MPSSQFEFKLCNTTVAQLDVKKSSVLGVNIGYTKVTLVDKSILCKTITVNNINCSALYSVQDSHLKLQQYTMGV